MKVSLTLLSGTIIGAAAALTLQAMADPPRAACAGPDLGRIYKRFDDLEQILTTLQSQAAKGAADGALANANSQRQLASISAQVADLNSQVVALSGRVR